MDEERDQESEREKCKREMERKSGQIEFTYFIIYSPNLKNHRLQSRILHWSRGKLSPRPIEGVKTEAQTDDGLCKHKAKKSLI